jgi:hypothetical protein
MDGNFNFIEDYLVGLSASIANLTGIKGATGATGSPGIPGATGSPGIPGATGSPGIPGATGSPGIPGATGSPGIPGATGSPGIPGATGSPGIPGATGATGSPPTYNNPIIKAYFETKLSSNTGFNPAKGFVELLDNGIFLPHVENLELPDTGFYAISAVETFQKLLSPDYGGIFTYPFVVDLLKIKTTDYSIFGSRETYGVRYLQYIKFVSPMNTIKNPVLNEDFLNKLVMFEQYNTLYNAEILDRINDKGIIEFGLINGKSQLDILFYLSNQLGIVVSENQNGDQEFSFGEFFIDRINDKGIVIIDTNKFSNINQFTEHQFRKGLMIISVEGFINYLENNTGVSVPA